MPSRWERFRYRAVHRRLSSRAELLCRSGIVSGSDDPAHAASVQRAGSRIGSETRGFSGRSGLRSSVRPAGKRSHEAQSRRVPSISRWTGTAISKSGHRWDPEAFYRDIRYGHIRGVDVKRAVGIVPIPASHRARAGVRPDRPGQVSDGVRRTRSTTGSEHNPVGFGVNWACTMDAAIRAANWLVGRRVLPGGRRSGCTVSFAGSTASLHEHGQFIRIHLERGERGTGQPLSCRYRRAALHCGVLSLLPREPSMAPILHSGADPGDEWPGVRRRLPF